MSASLDARIPTFNTQDDKVYLASQIWQNSNYTNDIVIHVQSDLTFEPRDHSDSSL